MKKFVLNKFFFIMWILMSLLFGVAIVILTVKSMSVVPAIIILPWFLLIFIGGFFATNRICCVMKISFDDRRIIREGLFFGFNARVDFDEILSIERYFVPRNGDFFILSSRNYNNIDGVRKNSAFFIPFNIESIEIIRKICLSSPNAHFDEKTLYKKWWLCYFASLKNLLVFTKNSRGVFTLY